MISVGNNSIKPIISMKTCIATVTSPDFVPGTLVLVHSFLKRNPWFGGDIVIITDGLQAGQEDLFRNFPNVMFRKPGDDLLLHIGSLCRQLPDYFAKRKRFYSIEVFNLQGYDQLFFFDSDMLVTGDLSEIMQHPADLMACSDMFGHPGRVRDKVTFKRKPVSDFKEESAFLSMTFNAGFIAIGSNYLNNNTYEGLMQLIHKDIYEKIRTHNTDQVVFNLYFDRKVAFLPVEYNFILSKSLALFETKMVDPGEVKILHFTGNYKPWKSSSKMDELAANPDFIPYFKRWHSEYSEVIRNLEGEK